MINDQYFPLEANMMSSDEICNLLREQGIKGFGVYMALLLELRKRDDHRSTLGALEVLAYTCRINKPYLRKIITDYNLFQVEGEGDSACISSPYLDKVMEKLKIKRQQRQENGRKGADKRWQKEDGYANGYPMAVKKSKEKKSKEEKNKEENTSSTSTPPRWEMYIDEAMNEQSWLELQAMNSGLGMEFIKHLDKIKQAFKEHVLTQGTERTILSLRDAKTYFANFIRKGTKTWQWVCSLLQEKKQKHRNTNPYRYEAVDETTGARSYCGIQIPPDAPPRPSENAVWDGANFEWSG